MKFRLAPRPGLILPTESSCYEAVSDDLRVASMPPPAESALPPDTPIDSLQLRKACVLSAIGLCRWRRYGAVVLVRPGPASTDKIVRHF
jgi:hypothetical protein